jgi:hypothetical protein
MGKVVEISVFKPQHGKAKEFLDGYADVKKTFLDAGASSVQVLAGSSGKDVGNIIVIQTFNSPTHAGSVNEKLGESSGLHEWMDDHAHVGIADLVSHDVYEVLED